jgi:hypothetical protein
MKFYTIKTVSSLVYIFLSLSAGYAQSRKSPVPDNKYISLTTGSANSLFRRVELYSEIDTTWDKWKPTNAFTLGNIGKDNIASEKPQGDDEANYKEDAKHVNYKELKTCGDGTMFYDKDNHIVVIKVDGKWMKLVVEALPENIKYGF